MTFNNIIAVAMPVFIVLLAISTVLVSVEMIKEFKRAKSSSKAPDKEEAEKN